MLKVYTHENRLLVSNAQNLLELNGIATTLKNEFAVGALGEIAPIEIWLELWVVHEKDYAKAVDLIENTLLQATTAPEWRCQHCGELNDGAFEVCWQCGKEPSS